MRQKGLRPFLYPRSVAVVGASPTQERVGFAILENLLSSPQPPRVFPVNPRGGEVMGLPIYPSLEALPEPVDLAMVAIGPGAIPEVVSGCARKGIRAVIISTPGFAEVGEEGRRLQEETLSIARRAGVRLVGPNTQGLFNLETGTVLLSVPFPTPARQPGPVSFICQSALFPWELLLHHPYLGLNKMVDLGNMCDVDIAECLEYLGDDPHSRVIAIHMEGMPRGRGLMAALLRIAPRKPVVVIKGGRTPEGSRAVASHTGSLAGEDRVYEAAFRQAGAFRARDMDDLADLLLALSCLQPVRGKRVGILTTTGAGGALAADACAELGLQVARLSPETLTRVRQNQPSWVPLQNPLDVWQVLNMPLIIQRLTDALHALMADPAVDGIVLVTHVVPDSPFDTLPLLQEFARNGLSKPMAVWALGPKERLTELAQLAPRGLVCFPSIARAVRALAVSYAFHSRQVGSA